MPSFNSKPLNAETLRRRENRKGRKQLIYSFLCAPLRLRVSALRGFIFTIFNISGVLHPPNKKP